MAEKKLNICKLVFLIISITGGIGLGIWRILINNKYLNTLSMQYENSANTILKIYKISYIAIIVCFIAFFFLFKSKMIPNENVNTSSKFSNIVAGTLILFTTIISLASLFINKNVTTVFKNEPLLCKVFAFITIFLFLISGLYFLFCDFNPKVKEYFSYTLPFAPIFYIVSSFFSYAYTVIDSNRLICNMAFAASALVALNIAQNNISKRSIKTSFIFSMVCMLMSVASILSSLGIIISSNQHYTTIFNYLEFVLIAYFVISLTYAIKSINNNNQPIETEMEDNQEVIDNQ